jgi:hypothetical protein
MSRLGKLKPLDPGRIKTPGMYADGGGLYLQITINARDNEPAKSWLYRYMLRGRSREMGLGSLNAVSLKQARTKAFDCRGLRADGIDPIEVRNAKRTQAVLDAAKAITFKRAAAELVDPTKRGRSTKAADPKPIAPFETDPDQAVA